MPGTPPGLAPSVATHTPPQLQRSALQLTPVAWLAHGEMPLEHWIDQGRRLGIMGRGAGWWIGDWLNFGNARYGEKYVRAAKITGYDTQSLMNMVYVASRYEVSRRRKSLSWSHHAELAALEPEEQDRWLDEVEMKRLSVHCLRGERRRVRRLADGYQAESRRSRASGRSRQAAVHHHHEVVCPECGFRFPPDAEGDAPAALRAAEHA